ncbi:MAG TPA: hypothetical protein ENJ95_01470 [Bacteroidetes bacterium]|nr:hypothetical protein [Bacteroidota bacterium]
MKIYRCKAVAEVQSFYGPLLTDINEETRLAGYLERLAERLWNGIKNKQPAIFHEISNYHKNYLGSSFGQVMDAPLATADAYATIAFEFGFSGWKEVEKMDGQTIDLHFETAVNHLLNGRLEQLKTMAKSNKNLLSQNSNFGHKATLLHYTASNGVELWRQQVPSNLPEAVKYLLGEGADKNAKMEVYGGRFDTLALVETSAHPFDAGLGEEVVEILKTF